MAEPFERRRLRVYVAGPISSDVFAGVHRGFAAGKRLFEDGLAPFIPHADAFWFLGEGNWNAYLEYDLEYVSVCDAVYRLDGESKGADLECEVARDLGLPVFRESCGCDFNRGLVEEYCFGNYEHLLMHAVKQGLAGKQQVHA